VLTAVTSVSELIVTFLQLSLFLKTAAFRIGVTPFEKPTSVRKLACDSVASKRSNHLRDSWLVSRNDGLQTGFSCLQYSAILDSFFYAYGAIVDSFVKVSFFLEKHYIP